MQGTTASAVRGALAAAVALLIFKVTVSVVAGYRDYFPPNFDSDFLLGRAPYFWGPYSWAFYAHLVAGPATLLVGTILIGERIRRWAPRWHRRLGRAQVLVILLLLVPSGLWMARYAATGAIAGVGLATLAITTAVCTAMGWRAAVRRRFEVHRRWMFRTYLLLCSAVVIRLIGGLADVCQFDALWLYPLSVWGSWLVPLLIYESCDWWIRRQRTRPPLANTLLSRGRCRQLKSAPARLPVSSERERNAPVR